MARDVLREVKVSYRQLEYWSHQGYIPGVEKETGSGVPREYTREQIEFIKIMSALTRGGMSPTKARDVATVLSAGGEVDLGHNVFIIRRT
jgi:DNA-binding transcriptional MerR regulator